MPFVDSRGFLPQAFAGGHAGLPCVRKRPFNAKRDVLPEIVRPSPEREGFPLPGARVETRPEHTSFSGTQNLTWAMARSRSMGSLATGGVLHKVLEHRKMTDLDILVGVMADALRSDRPTDIRSFRQPYNPHRHVEDLSQLSMEQRRKKVLQVLQKHPLLHIYDLATASPEYWSVISRELGGLQHGAVMKEVLTYVQQNMAPMDRATFWSACGPRQRAIDMNRQMSFAANTIQNGPNLHRWEDSGGDSMLALWEQIPVDRVFTLARPGVA